MPAFVRDGLRFHYRESGQGPPVIFQHGLGGDVDQPFGLLDPLPGFRLIALDFRAHGQTWPLGDPAKLGIAAFADDLAALLDVLRLPQVVVGGISLGAAVALDFAIRYPQRTLGLILSRPAWLDEPFPPNVRVYPLLARLIRDHGALAGLAFFQTTAEYRDTLAESPDAANSLVGQFRGPRAEEFVARLEAIPHASPPGSWDHWKRIAVPTLVLANRQDPIHPFAYGEALVATIPGASLRELTPKSVSPAGHAEDSRRAVEDFLHEHFPTETLPPC